MYCHHCGEQLIESDIYCPYCGTKIPYLTSESIPANTTTQKTDFKDITMYASHKTGTHTRNSKRKCKKRIGIKLLVAGMILIVILCGDIIITSLLEHNSNRVVSTSDYKNGKNDSIKYSNAIVLNEASTTGAEFSCTLKEFIDNYNFIHQTQFEDSTAYESVSKILEIDNSDIYFVERSEENYDLYEYDSQKWGYDSSFGLYQKSDGMPDWYIAFYVNPSTGNIHELRYCTKHDTQIMNEEFAFIFLSLELSAAEIENYIKEIQNNELGLYYSNGILSLTDVADEEGTPYYCQIFSAWADDAYQALISGKESRYPKKIEIVKLPDDNSVQSPQVEITYQSPADLSPTNVEADITDNNVDYTGVKMEERNNSGLEFPQLIACETLQNSDGHTISITGSTAGFDGMSYSFEISIVRTISLNCIGTVVGDKLHFSSEVSSGNYDGYIQYNGQDYTLVFENSEYPLTTEKVFYGFYKQSESVSADTSYYIGTWVPEYDGLRLSIDSYDGQFMQGTIYTDIGAIPFSGYYDSGLFASYSYGEYLVNLALFQNEYNGMITNLGIECSITNQNYDILFGTTGQTKLYKS